MRYKLLTALLLASGSLLTAQVSVGVRIGPPPSPRVMRIQPRQPGPDYIFVQGYWYPQGNHYRWHEGYWTRAPFAGARWVEPRHDSGMYYQGYWDDNSRRFDHDHRWDRDRNNRDHDRGRDDNRR